MPRIRPRRLQSSLRIKADETSSQKEPAEQVQQRLPIIDAQRQKENQYDPLTIFFFSIANVFRFYGTEKPITFFDVLLDLVPFEDKGRERVPIRPCKVSGEKYTRRVRFFARTAGQPCQGRSPFTTFA